MQKIYSNKNDLIIQNFIFNDEQIVNVLRLRLTIYSGQAKNINNLLIPYKLKPNCSSGCRCLYIYNSTTDKISTYKNACFIKNRMSIGGGSAPAV